MASFGPNHLLPSPPGLVGAKRRPLERDLTATKSKSLPERKSPLRGSIVRLSKLPRPPGERKIRVCFCWEIFGYTKSFSIWMKFQLGDIWILNPFILNPIWRSLDHQKMLGFWSGRHSPPLSTETSWSPAEVAAIEGVLVESATSSRLLQVDLQWRPGRFLDWEGHERIGDY
jgi:hypothetical protein